jgi:DNA gyrase subunit A
MPEKIVPVQASKQYRADYKEYALYVERHRCVPAIEDGLKPVVRRIIYAARTICKAHEGKVKCANIIGATMGNYHPHGDSSIEGALYGCINWFQTKMPLFIGQGNFGNTFQNVPAAARYTEAALSPFALECLVDEVVKIKEVIDWEPNYDSSKYEPMFLPCKVPLLLINGCTGIAVGDKVDIPTHNICEVIDATIALMKNPNARILLVPDHCQACEIIDTDWKTINKGHGNYKVRGVIDIEPYKGDNNKYKGYTTLVIKSCPNMVFLESVINKIESMVKDNKIVGIIDMEEQSTVFDMRYVIVIKPGTDPNFIRSEIYKNTPITQTARVNFKVLDITDKENIVKRLTYKQYIQLWLDFRRLTKLRYYENLLQIKMTRLHMINNFIYAIENGITNDLIDLIRANKSTDDNELIEKLIKKCNITDIQAKFFINCELKKLSKGYYNNYKAEQIDLIEITKRCRDMILIDGMIDEEIISELIDIRSRYGEPRKCKVISANEANGITAGAFKIVLTEGNFIKKVSEQEILTKTKNDNIKFVLVGDNSKNILLFDAYGKVYNIPICKIPFADKSSNGIDIRLINKNINSQITAVIYGPTMEQFSKGFIVTLTKNGFIKRMTTTDFLAVPASGLVYCKLDDDDRIIDLLLFGNNAEIVVYGNKRALRIDINDIPILKRNARGCVSMASKTTNVEGMSAMSKQFTDFVVVTKNGYINRIIPDSVQKGRSKAGSNVIKLGKTDNIVAVYGVNNNDILMNLIAPTGEIVEIPVMSIPAGSSISTGNKMIKGGEVVKVQKK